MGAKHLQSSHIKIVRRNQCVMMRCDFDDVLWSISLTRKSRHGASSRL